MEQIITEICNDDLKKEAFTNTQFIFFAERGAMGEAGKILIVTSGGSIFHGNYCFGNIKLTSLYRAVPILKVCNFDTLGKVTGIPDDWKYEYLGAGNHLLRKVFGVHNFIRFSFRNSQNHLNVLCLEYQRK